jgi:hypothetical protein
VIHHVVDAGEAMARYVHLDVHFATTEEGMRQLRPYLPVLLHPAPIAPRANLLMAALCGVGAGDERQ